MALDKSKTDNKLGTEVEQHLRIHKVNTPTTEAVNANSRTQQSEIQHHVKSIMEVLGLDLSDDSLEETPKRVAKMFVNEVFWGLKEENFPKITTVAVKNDAPSMVLEKNITVHSNCEHHLVPIIGVAHIAYIPKAKILGLSKLNRVTEYFARRPQIQERLTDQIYHALQYILETDDIAVMIDAEHMCVKTRGVEDSTSSTMTSKIGGCFLQPEVRAEFFNLVNGR